MERYCGLLQPAIRSRRFPYACLNHYVLDHARLSHIKMKFNITSELVLRPSRQETGTSIPSCKRYSPTRSVNTTHCLACQILHLLFFPLVE